MTLVKPGPIDTPFPLNAKNYLETEPQHVPPVYAPGFTDKYMERTVISGTKSDKPARPREQNALDHPSERLAERGDYPGHVAQTSLYTQASLHPAVVGAALVVAGLALAELLRESGDGARRRASSRSRGRLR